MAATLLQQYKCDACSAPAVKHLQCGLLIDEALATAENISTIPYTASDFNLCDQHLIAANVAYVHYNESDLDQ